MHDEEGAVIGFLMWGIDDEDGRRCWLGGVIVDAAHQGRGVGRAAMAQALATLRPRDDDAGVRPRVPPAEHGGRRVSTPAWGSSRRARPTTTRSWRGAVRLTLVGRVDPSRRAALHAHDRLGHSWLDPEPASLEDPSRVRTLLNIIWFRLFGGFWLAVGYAFAGLVLCLLIVTIPLGVAAFRMARYAIWPFRATVVQQPDAGAGSVVLNILWIVLAGWWLALGHVITAVAQAITIIGIPLAIANLKMIPIALPLRQADRADRLAVPQRNDRCTPSENPPQGVRAPVTGGCLLVTGVEARHERATPSPVGHRGRQNVPRCLRA